MVASHIAAYSNILNPRTTYDLAVLTHSRWDQVNGTYKYRNSTTGKLITTHYSLPNNLGVAEMPQNVSTIDYTTIGYTSFSDRLEHPKYFTAIQQAIIDIKCDRFNDNSSLSPQETKWKEANC